MSTLPHWELGSTKRRDATWRPRVAFVVATRPTVALGKRKERRKVKTLIRLLGGTLTHLEKINCRVIEIRDTQV
jgi:hypothetical protein